MFCSVLWCAVCYGLQCPMVCTVSASLWHSDHTETLHKESHACSRTHNRLAHTKQQSDIALTFCILQWLCTAILKDTQTVCLRGIDCSCTHADARRCTPSPCNAARMGGSAGQARQEARKQSDAAETFEPFTTKAARHTQQGVPIRTPAERSHTAER